MNTNLRWRYAAGSALVAAVVVFLLMVFYLLGHTDLDDRFLMDTRSQRFGWRYELLVNDRTQPYEPAYDGEYLLLLPEGTQAVRISRIMTEDIPNAELAWSCYYDGIEVFLDGRLLYSDFQETERDADGFLFGALEELTQINDNTLPAGIRRVRMTLPADYLGKELSVITYFPMDGRATQPEYPVLGNNETLFAQPSVSLTIPILIMGATALLSLLLTVMFVLDLSNNRADPRILLIALYFLLLFLKLSFSTDPGYYGLLARHTLLRFLGELYLAPLYLYLALRLTGIRRYLFCLVISAWTLFDGIRIFPSIYRGGNEQFYFGDGLGLLLLFIALIAALGYEMIRDGRFRNSVVNLRYGMLTVAVTVVSLLCRAQYWDSIPAYLYDGLYQAIRQKGDFTPLVSLLTDFISIMATILLAREFLFRFLRNRQTITALEERSRLTLESYERLLAAENSTNVLRHELRHHLMALSAILDSGDLDRMRKYISSISKEFEQLPTGRYSNNILVNVVTGTYLDRAQAEGIRIEHRLNVPQELEVSDRDLCVLLSNMLQNALEACERMPASAERYIRFYMHLHGTFLFVQCINSRGDDRPSAEKMQNPREHGYGLAAMRRVVKKYTGDLEVEPTPGAFKATAYLMLKQG